MTHRPLKQFLINQNITYEDTEGLWKNISEKEKDGMFLYNYNDAFLVPRDHPVIVKCRGLVLDVEGKVLCYPFDRFFNDFEAECADIDWPTSMLLEKVDGSLINVFFHNEEWRVTTHGSFYPNDSGVNYKEIFKRLFKGFERLNPNFNYMFELVSKENRIVTHYDEEFVVLIGARNRDTLVENDQMSLDMEASILNIMRPLRYESHDIVSSRLLFNGLKDDDEGFVIVDKDFNRIKMKQESYFQLAKIVNLNDQAIYEHVIGVKPVDSELIDKLPEVTDKINEIATVLEGIKKVIYAAFQDVMYFDNGSRKSFAERVRDDPYKGVLFNLYDKKDIAWDKLKWATVKEWAVVKQKTKEELLSSLIACSQGWEAELFYSSFNEDEARRITMMIVDEIKEVFK